MWLNNSKRRIFLDMHLPDWPDKKVATRFDPDAIAAAISKSHADSIILYAKCQYGNFYYNTQIGHKHSGLGQLDLFNDVKARLHAHGIKVIAYYSVSWDEYIAKLHPEWLVQGPDGERGNDEFRWQTLCLNSPYRAMVFDHIREIMMLAQPDGFWIDMTIIGQKRCHCPYCHEQFKNRYGEDIPKDAGHAAYHRFMQWRYDYTEEFYGQLREIVRQRDPQIMFTNNYWGYPYSSAWMGSRAIGALQQVDYVTGEAYTDWTGLNAPSFFSKFLRSAAGGRPYEALIGRFCNTWDYTVKPFEQLAFEAYTIAANGGTVTVDDEPYFDGTIDLKLYENIGKIFQEIKKREAYLGGSPLKYAAILHSQHTKDFFNDYGNHEFIQSIAGSYRMMRDLHYPVDFVFDENFDQVALQDYQVMLLPSVAVLPEKILKKLKAYVVQGGLLITSGPTGLYEVVNGRLQAHAGYQTTFGVEIEGLSEYSLSYLKFRDATLPQSIVLERPSLVKGKWVKYKGGQDCTTLAALVEPICETTKETFFHNNLPSPYNATAYPALFVKRIGAGYVVSFAQPVLTHYAKQHQLELKTIVKEMIQRYASQRPLVEFECPNRIDIAVARKADTLIVHLLNPNPGMSVCCGYMDVFEGAYPRTFEYMDEILPVHNLRIIINADKMITVESVGEKSGLHLKQLPGQSMITLETLHLWETMKITLQ